MTANEVRTKFLNFFKSKGHTIVASDSLVPKDDPTVLFTTAGMQQFKRQFLGYIEGYTRAASCQKCLRTDDLDKIGKTAYHHTFFEMLGNFSFGDYFKKEAIEYAWEFLTKEMKLPSDKLWASVYEEDDEAYNIWLKNIKLPKEKVIKLGDKDNFWPAEAKTKGPNGPCGPCSEIFYDFGVNPKCKKGKNCNPACDCGRFTEVWNLVFTQFNRKEGRVLEPLPNKNIDTGMGLERLVAVVQGKKSNYETDLFEPILRAIDKNIKITEVSFDINLRHFIADHMRATVIAIADGVPPSNKEKGSVIRRLITEMSDIAIRNGNIKPVIFKLVPSIIETLKGGYPDLETKAKSISEHIENIENAFSKIRIEQIPRFEDIADENKNDPKILGKNIFIFKDRHGLTLSTMRTGLRLANVSDENIEKAFKIYEKQMQEQQHRSRAASKMTGDMFADIELNLAGTPKTKFIGYTHFDGKGKILKLFVDDVEVNQISIGDHTKVILDQTPFYAEAGGQIGDTGYLVNEHGKIRVLDTKKQDDIYIHFGKVEEGELKVGETVQAEIDAERRLSIMRNHTATHLLQSALREILGTHVQQQGSLVAEDRLRFDFTHPKALTKEQLMQIEDKIRERIAHNDKVIKKEMPLEEAKKQGALAFFAEKYKDRVRIISIGNYSKEFCGGTHLDSTGEIERFVISAEGAVAQGIRRLEARTASGAEEFMKEHKKKELERKQSDEKRQQELKNKKDADRHREETFKNNLKIIIDKADSINNIKIVVYKAENSNPNQLKNFFDIIKQQVSPIIFCSGTSSNDSATIVIGTSGDLVKMGVNANEIIKDLAPLINGTGGGRPDLAQAGSKEPEKLDQALQQATKIIKGKLV